MTVSASDERRLAVASADGTCPRCGTARASDQRYCLECGFALPVVVGRIPSMRRRWIGRFGWYPGDWIWAALPTLVIAVAGAAAAIAVTDHRRSEAPSFVTAPAAVSLAQPASPVSTSASQTVGTAKLPTAPEPTTAAPNGRIVWPANENGWTIVLVSYPKGFGRPQAAATAARAAKAGLSQVGIVDSSRYASLQPGYYVVFTGIYASKADADAAVATAKQAGFPGAYSREIAR